MGREIEKAAKAKNITVKSIVDIRDSNAAYREINKESMQDVDVCIDFTHPDSAVENIKTISNLTYYLR